MKIKPVQAPNTIKTKTARALEIHFEENRMRIVGEGTTSIEWIKKLSNEAFEGFINVIELYSTSGKRAASGLLSAVQTLERAIKRTQCQKLDLESYFEITANITKTDKSRVLGLLRFWRNSGFSGLSDDLRVLLPFESGSAGYKSNRLHSLIGGAYSQQEHDDLISTFWYDYDNDLVSLQNTTLYLLNAQHSRRPVQYAHLKISDFECDGSAGPRVSYPGAKDTQAPGFRDGKKETHPINLDVWKLCQLQIRETISRFEDLIGEELSSENRKKLPFLLTPYKARLTEKKAEVDQFSSLEDYYSSKSWHMTSASIIKKLRDRSGSAVHSYRTGAELNEFCYRMRYTKAKELVRLGIPKTVLSNWLGHESSTAYNSYYDDPAERAKEIQESFGHIYAPIAQAFMGCLISDERDATRGSDPSSRIELDGSKPVGNCGHEGFCSAAVPVPCYRCSKFQPWVDGPHEQVLIRLYERQEEENNIFIQSSSRRLLAPLQLDKDIRAVQTVIDLCKEHKKSKSK